MAWSLYLNETSLASIEVYVLGVRAWRDGPSRTFPTLSIPGRDGVLLVADPEVGARTMSLELVVQPAARTLAARLAAEDQLKALAYRGLARLVEDDGVNPPRQIDGVCTRCAITPQGHPLASVTAKAELELLCPAPTWQDVVGSSVGFNATAVAVPTGTAVSSGIIQIAAPHWSVDVDTPTVSYLSAGGVTVASMTLGGVTGAADLEAGLDYVELDLNRCTITRYDSGVASNGAALLTAGDWFAIDPQDAEPLSGSYPMLKVTAVAGTPSGIWIGQRRWL